MSERIDLNLATLADRGRLGGGDFDSGGEFPVQCRDARTVPRTIVVRGQSAEAVFFSLDDASRRVGVGERACLVEEA